MVDELTIQYPGDVPGVRGWMNSSQSHSEAEKALIAREYKGWRRFWERYARSFTNLKKITANVPVGIYNDWGKCEGFRELLTDKRWQMLDVEENGGDFGFFGSYFPFSSLKYNFARRRSRMKFVQRVFFRQDAMPLQISPRHPSLSIQEREKREITDEEIAKSSGFTQHRFWPVQQAKKEKDVGEKRRTSDTDGGVDGAENGEPAKKKAKTD